MRRLLALELLLIVALVPICSLRASEVQVIAEMRRMFSAHVIGANVELEKVNSKPHLYALGPVAGLQGEITVLDGQVFVSRIRDRAEVVALEPKAKSVFLVGSFVPDWRSSELPTKVQTEKDLAEFLEKSLPADIRSAFLVRGTARRARCHIQDYQGSAKDLTHLAHDQAKVFYELENTKVELVGFFTNHDGDGGTFVHMGQTTHIHLISEDRKHMGHLESIELLPGAQLLLP